MPSENDLEFDLLAEAFSHYLDVKKQHDKAYAKYEGYSWDYHGNVYVEALDEARKDTKSKLKDVIKATVKEIMQDKESELE